jgi:glutathione synthase/RimK-type ligase-like ATP-grasp enzyme
MRIALATASRLAFPDPDEPALREALARAGAESEMCVWDDERVDWRTFDACVLRSTWDYFHRALAFVAWAARTAEVTRIWNPPAVVAGNVHKSYLRHLARRGIPVVPTEWASRGQKIDLAARLAGRGWSAFVVKPAVSAGAYETIRGDGATLAEASRHTDALLAHTDIMIQPYLPGIEDAPAHEGATGEVGKDPRGEISVIVIDGEPTHAVRKRPAFGRGSDAREYARAVELTENRKRFARRLLDAAPRDLLYARVDFVESPDAEPCLMELELVEPHMFLGFAPPDVRATDRLAEAIVKRARLGAR